MFEDEVIGVVQEDEIEVCMDVGEVCGKHSCDVMAGTRACEMHGKIRVRCVLSTPPRRLQWIASTVNEIQLQQV